MPEDRQAVSHKFHPKKAINDVRNAQVNKATDTQGTQ